MSATLVSEVSEALGAAGEPLERAAAAIRAALAVDRVSISRIDASGERFEIAADAGAELLAPGTALPVSTCSYFSAAVEGRAFHEQDFDASRTFLRPLDSVVLATGFHSGCSVPVRSDGRTVGVISLSSSAHRSDMAQRVDDIAPLGDVVAAGLVGAAPPPASRVLVCHADALAGRGIARLIEHDGGARATVSPTLADAIASALDAAPDFVVCDDLVDGLDVHEAARVLRRAGVHAPLLVVSSRDTPESVRASLRAGAAAHVRRRDAVRTLPLALAAVRAGGTLLPEAPDEEEGVWLTARERELLGLLDEGLRFKQVAWRLGISEATAKTHGRNLFRKLGATSRAEAVHAARERGLLA